MALRARLVAPPPVVAPIWHWHKVKTKAVPARLLFAGERRMEAETYLSSGFGLRLAIESIPNGWQRFGDLAYAWTPPRIKMIHVDETYGVPYLNTSQLFDVRPSPRKWLAMGRTTAGRKRLTKQGTILVMASATPGRATITTKAHENAIISHHFMRVEPKRANAAGWLYAFLKSSQGYAMVSGSQYASIIRHIEPSHLASVPVPNVDAATEVKMNEAMLRIVKLRNRAASAIVNAERVFADAIVGIAAPQDENGFQVSARDLFLGRRRMDAAHYDPRCAGILATFPRHECLRKVCRKVFWPNRFRRVYNEDGVPYMSAEDVFSINPQLTKRIAISQLDDPEACKVDTGWILMARSGQVYGLIGAAAIATEIHAKSFVSDDMIRIVPNESLIRSGYLVTALTHPTLGRPLLIREAYGTSIPHLDPEDVARFPVVRLGEAVENRVADLAEGAARARSEADEIERSMAAEADEIIERSIC